MNTLAVTFVVLVSDQAVKLLLHRFIGSRGLSLGPFGTVRVVAGRLWLRRLGGQTSGAKVWCLWTAAAVPLVIVSALLPACAPFVGLLLGGSLSNGIESSMHGNITDYICLRFWPAFNLADLALTVGVAGMASELLTSKCVMIF
jgi:signal peptidase II